MHQGDGSVGVVFILLIRLGGGLSGRIGFSGVFRCIRHDGPGIDLRLLLRFLLIQLADQKDKQPNQHDHRQSDDQRVFRDFEFLLMMMVMAAVMVMLAAVLAVL